MTSKTFIGEGPIFGLYPNKLREIQYNLRNAFTPNIRVSPLYPKTKNRPGYVFFVTIWTHKKVDPNAPTVYRKPLSWFTKEV